jgi:hypothetical protein
LITFEIIEIICKADIQIVYYTQLN